MNSNLDQSNHLSTKKYVRPVNYQVRDLWDEAIEDPRKRIADLRGFPLASSRKERLGEKSLIKTTVFASTVAIWALQRRRIRAKFCSNSVLRWRSQLIFPLML